MVGFGVSYKFLSSFRVWFRGTGRGFGSAPRQKHKRCAKVSMSTPKNHHFVSQVHIKNFFNKEEKKIYVYDKIKKNHYCKNATKTLFSEIGLNSKYSNGEVDHESLEKDLNDYFEKDFTINTQCVENFVKRKVLNEEVEKALVYFAKYGIIGVMRTPRFKKSMDTTFFDVFKTISENAVPELKARIEEMFEYKNEVNYSNVLNYSETVSQILELMGNLVFKIITPINQKDFFLIPDFAAATARAKINKYFNPDIEEIVYIGIPLTSKIYIHFHSEKLFKRKEIPPSLIIHCSSEEVEIVNKTNFDYCQDKVACENENYLKEFIRSY